MYCFHVELMFIVRLVHLFSGRSRSPVGFSMAPNLEHRVFGRNSCLSLETGLNFSRSIFFTAGALCVLVQSTVLD